MKSRPANSEKNVVGVRAVVGREGEFCEEGKKWENCQQVSAYSKKFTFIPKNISIITCINNTDLSPTYEDKACDGRTDPIRRLINFLNSEYDTNIVILIY